MDDVTQQPEQINDGQAGKRRLRITSYIQNAVINICDQNTVHHDAVAQTNPDIGFIVWHTGCSTLVGYCAGVHTPFLNLVITSGPELLSLVSGKLSTCLRQVL